MRALLIVSLFLLVNAPAAFAQSAYRTVEPSYQYPLPMLFNSEDAANDPSILPEDVTNPRFRQFLDSADVVCFDDQTFALSLRENIDELQSNLRSRGATSVLIDTIPNFALDSDKIIDQMDETFTLRGLINFYDNSDPYYYRRTRYAQGYNPTEGSEKLNTNIKNTDGSIIAPNLLATDGFLARLLSPQQQFDSLIAPWAKTKKACCSDNPPATLQCDANYYCKPGVRSCDVAGLVPNNFEQFNTLDQGTKDKIQACTAPSMSTLTAYLVIKPIFPFTDRTMPDRAQDMLAFMCPNVSDCTTKYARVLLYGLKGSTDMNLLENQLLNTPLNNQKTQTSLNSMGNGSVSWNSATSINAALESKINGATTTCASNLPDQFMVGTAPSHTQDNAVLNWLLQLVNPSRAETNTPLKYKVYLVAPEETKVQEYLNSQSPSASSKAFFKPDQVKQFTPINNPIPFDTQTNSPTFENPSGSSLSPTPYPGATLAPYATPAPARAGYSVSPNKKASIAGGDLIQYSRTYLSQMLMLWPGHKDYFSDTCYAQQIIGRIPLAGTLVGNLLSALAPASCPDPLASQSSSGGACSTNRTNGSCNAICNTDAAGQYLASVGYSEVPSGLLGIIESASQAYNVPPSLVLGVMFAEGGFQREACYGKWTEDSVASACTGEVNNCNTCNVSSAGAKGPFQIIPKYIPGEIGGNPCNLYDAAKIIAYSIAHERDGNPVWTDKSCGSWTYNIPNAPGVHYPQSCADWTEKDVATAARAIRGLCDIQYIQHIVDFWKLYSCG